jgi:hypothetical protein
MTEHSQHNRLPAAYPKAGPITRLGNICDTVSLLSSFGIKRI